MARNDQFSEEDQKALDALMAKKLKSDWKTRETMREANLEALAPLAAVFTTEKVVELQNAAANNANLLRQINSEMGGLLDNVANILAYSGGQVCNFLDMLRQPEPDPTTTPETTEQPQS